MDAEAAGAGPLNFLQGLRADLAYLSRAVNPWQQLREIRTDVDTLKDLRRVDEATLQSQSQEIEFLRGHASWVARIDQRAEKAGKDLQAVSERLLALENEYRASARETEQCVADLEKLRLRLSAPEKDDNPRPKMQAWPDRRRELERKYKEEKVNATENNAA